MDREELISEISMRTSISMADVEEVLEQEDIIIEEDFKRREKKKKICTLATILVFLAGVVAALLVLDKKEKIDIDDIEDMVKVNVKKYTDKCMETINTYRK